MNEKVAIIGAGAYGLALGSYLAMNGFRVEIFEKLAQPGGVCTAWKRNGYTFDACIHWLMGSGPGTSLHELWKELHAVQGRTFVEWEEYLTVRLRGGETFTVYTDPERLEKEMLRIAPEDGRAIRRLCNSVRSLSNVDIPVGMDRMSLPRRIGALLAMVPLGPALIRWGRISVERYRAGLRSPALAEAMGQLYGDEDDMSDFPILGFIMMLAFMHRKSCGYPIGGSLEFSRAIERRFCELGGAIHYGKPVDRIIVDDGKAVGVGCGPEEFGADVVVSCADGHATIYDMLGGRYLSPRIRQAYETYRTFPSLIYVGLGIARDMKDQPSTLLFPLKKEIVLEDGALVVRNLGVRFFTFDPTMAPAGKTAAIVSISTRNHEYWTGLRRRDPAGYRTEKERVGRLLVEALDEEIGDIAGHVEAIDVATPATWIRYTGTWKGSYEGFVPTRKTVMKNLAPTLPGLDRFYMSSQWVTIGGGLPPAAMYGRALAKTICRRFGRKFRVVA
jgi:phytoene dehydrogenase-like protein